MRLKKEQEQIEQEKINSKAERMLSYAKIVKDTHWPEVSQKKKKQIEESKHALTQRNQKLREPNFGSPSQDPVPSHRIKKGKKKMHWDAPNTMRPPSEVRRQPKQVDYLKER